MVLVLGPAVRTMGPLVGGDPYQHAHAVASVPLPSGGVLLACMNTGGVIRLWDAETGDAVRPTLRADISPLALAAVLADDRPVVLATSEDEEVLAWDALTGEQFNHALSGLSVAATTSPSGGTALVATGTRAGDITISVLGAADDA